MAHTDEQTTNDMPTRHTKASTQRVTAETGIEYAYRDVGAGEVPLLLLQHFRGNLDNWDPALVDALAANRRVVSFDNVGVGATSGTTPNTIEAMAHDAITFIEAMGFQKPICLASRSAASSPRDLPHPPRPPTTRGAASSAPRGAAGMHGLAPEVIGAVGRSKQPSGIPRGLLRPRRTRAASQASRPQGDLRADRRPDEPTTWQTRQAQYDAVCPWGIPNHSQLQRVATSTSRCSSPTATATR